MTLALKVICCIPPCQISMVLVCSSLYGLLLHNFIGLHLRAKGYEWPWSTQTICKPRFVRCICTGVQKPYGLFLKIWFVPAILITWCYWEIISWCEFLCDLNPTYFVPLAKQSFIQFPTFLLQNSVFWLQNIINFSISITGAGPINYHI